MLANRTRRPEQDHNIVRHDGPQRVLVTNIMPSIQQFLDPLGHISGLFSIGVLPDLNGMKFYLRFTQRLVGDTFIQRFIVSIVQTANLRRHTLPKHIVYSRKHCATRAEVGGQHDLSTHSGTALLRIVITLIFFQENTGIRQAELVDRLLNIANHKTVLVFQGNCGKNPILHRIGILVLIYQNLPEPAAYFPGDLCWAAAGFSQEQIQGSMLQISKIQNPAAALQPVIFL